ncbi:hypothetical protein ACB092_01G271400 [Castanea dentata]
MHEFSYSDNSFLMDELHESNTLIWLPSIKRNIFCQGCQILHLTRGRYAKIMHLVRREKPKQDMKEHSYRTWRPLFPNSHFL